jgi:hypothetical protein
VEAATLHFIVADRWQAFANVFHAWFDETRTSGATPNDRWSWNYGAGMSYYIEDNLGLSLAVAGSQNWIRGTKVEVLPSGSQEHAYNRVSFISLGLTYRFAGWFDAPAFPATVLR